MTRATCTAILGCFVASCLTLRAEESQPSTPSAQLSSLIDASHRLESTGDIPSAITTTEDALQRVGRAHFRRQELEYRLIDLHIRAGTLDQLIAESLSGTQSVSSAATSWNLLALIYRVQGKHAERLEALRSAHSLSPADESISRELAEMESAFGNHASATKIVEDSLKRRPNDIEWTLLSAKFKVREKHLDAAESSLSALTATYPDDTFLRNRIASFYQAHRMTDALRQFMLEKNPLGDLSEFTSAVIIQGHQDPELLAALADSAVASGIDHAPSANELADLAEAIGQTGDTTRAIELIASAQRLHPSDPELLRTLLMLCAKTSNSELAIASVDAAVATHPGLAPQLDYQLFQLLGSASQTHHEERETADSLVSGLMDSMNLGGSHRAGIKQREADLQSRWEESKAPLDARRLALWQSWRNEPEAADATLRLALADSPNDTPLLELKLDLAQKSGDHMESIELAEQLESIQPERSADWQSKRAAILVDQGQFDGAIRIYQQLVDTDPSSSNAWMDLASAQQRSGNYFGALDSWLTAFQTANETAKVQIRTPILAVIERLRLWQNGLDFLTSYAASQSEESAVILAYEEAVAFAIQHDQIDYLRERLDALVATSENLNPILLAQAALAKATGDNQKTLDLLSRASTHATDTALVWSRLLDAAVSANDYDRAVLAATALIQEDDSSKAWIQLASTQEAMDAPSDAAATWSLIVNRFNRDPEALEAAADFFDRRGETLQATATRLAAAQIDGASPETIYRSVRIAMASGDRTLALELCDRILAQTKPITLTNLSLPGAAENDPALERRSFSIAMQSMGGLNDPESLAALRKTAESAITDSVESVRLQAIQTRAQLSRDGTERETWSAWCKQSKSPLEAVWGWYAMGAYPEALDIIESRQEDQLPADREQSMAWIAIKGDQMERLRLWIDQSPEDRRRRSEFVFLALSRLLLTTTHDTDRLGILFPLKEESVRERWQAAWMLAAHGKFQSAVELASPALDITPASILATGAQTLASWKLILRDTSGAVDALSHVTRSHGTSLDQPAFQAWRMRWLLESDAGRATMESKSSLNEDPVFQMGTLALAAAMRNDAEATRLAAENLVLEWTKLAPAAGSNDSLDVSIRSSVGMALTLNLPVLAFELIHAANHVQQSRSLLHEAMANGFDRDIAVLSLLAKLQCTPPAQVAYQLGESTPPVIDAPTLVSLFRQLDSSGHRSAASVILSEVLRSHTSDVGSISELAYAARRVGDSETEVEVLEAMIALMPESKHFPTFADTALRLSDLYLRMLRPSDALALVNRGSELAPSDPRFAQMADRALRALGDSKSRIQLWKEQSAYFPESVGVWILALFDGGETKELTNLTNQWINEGKPFSTQTLVALISASAYENSERANQWLKQLAGRGAWSALAQAARSVKGAKSEPVAVSHLRDGIERTSSPEEKLACSQALIELTAGDLDQKLADKISHVAEKLVRTDPSHREAGNQIDVLIGKTNPQLADWWTARLRQRCESGADPQLAWIAMVNKHLDDADLDGASALVESQASVFDWPRPALLALADRLAQAKQHKASAHLYELLYREDPTQQNDAFAAATQLWHSGERYSSRKLVEPFIMMRWFDPVIHSYLAAYYYETGDPAQASNYFSEIVARDPGVTKPDAWAALAEIHFARQNLPVAKQFLDAAYSNPGFTDVEPLVLFLRANSAPQIDCADTLSRLSPALHNKLRLAMIQKLLSHNEPTLIQPWLATSIATSADGLILLDQLASRAEVASQLETFWTQAAHELPKSRDLSDAHANFLLAQAERASATASASTDAITLYQSAHEAAPWRFDTTGAYAQRLIDKNLRREASAALRKMLGSAPAPIDRHKALKMLAELDGSDDLIIPTPNS